MTTKEQYEAILPYKEVIVFFNKYKQYVGGADGLFEYLRSIGHSYTPGCNSCLSGLLILAFNMINEYEWDL